MNNKNEKNIENKNSRKSQIKENIAKKILYKMKEKKWSFSKLATELQMHDADITGEHSVRAWVRSDSDKSTIPTILNIIALTKVLNISIEELVGKELVETNQESTRLFSIVRNPRDKKEKELLENILDIEKEYFKKSNRDNHNKTIIDSFFNFQSLKDHNDQDHYHFKQLLLTKICDVNVNALDMDEEYMKELDEIFTVIVNKNTKKIFENIKVYVLPSCYESSYGSPECLNGISQFVFAAAAAYNFSQIVKCGDRVGLTGGKTMYSMARLIPRNGNIRFCKFFPLSLTDIILNSPITCKALVNELCFQFDDYGVTLQERVADDSYRRDYLSTADSVFFSVGNFQNSTFSTIMKKNIDQADISILEKHFVGDVLFNYLNKDGKTIEELAEESERCEVVNIAKKIINSSLYKNHFKNSHINITEIMKYASKKDHKTIIIAGGRDKKDVMLAFKKCCKNYLDNDEDGTKELRFTLITEQSLAKGIVDEVHNTAP